MSNSISLFNQADIWLMKKVGFLEVLPLTFHFSLAQTDIGRDWRQGTEAGAGADLIPCNYQIQTSNRATFIPISTFVINDKTLQLNGELLWV